MNNLMQAVPLAKSYLLLNHGPVVLVGSAGGDCQNVMAASWVMPLDFDPPKVLLVVDRSSITRKLIELSGEFSLNIPCVSMAPQVLLAGSLSGRVGDKMVRCDLKLFEASCVAAPLVSGCVAWLECRVVPEPRNQEKYDLFIAEVLAAWCDPSIFSEGRWHFPDAGRRTLHYQAGGAFFATGESIQVTDGIG